MSARVQGFDVTGLGGIHELDDGELGEDGLELPQAVARETSAGIRRRLKRRPQRPPP